MELCYATMPSIYDLHVDKHQNLQLRNQLHNSSHLLHDSVHMLINVGYDNIRLLMYIKDFLPNTLLRTLEILLSSSLNVRLFRMFGSHV